MSAAFKSSCVVTEFPLPDREYRVTPPERRPQRRASQPRRFERRRRPVLPLLLLSAFLFGCGFWLGLSAAAQEPPADASAGDVIPMAVPPASAGTQGALPAENGVWYLGMPVAEPDTAAGQAIDSDAWNLMLINGDNPLPDSFTVPQLTSLSGGHSVDSRVYSSLQRMLDDARAAGYQPLICSSFRTWETQERLFRNKVQRLLDQGYSAEEADREAAMWVARPGTSEHQAGLAVDIVDTEYQMLDQAQEDRPVQQWLMAHCAEYGFILRYPTSKSEITGVGYEPWHYRYVGEEAAKAIMEQGICLEEYLA